MRILTYTVLAWLAMGTLNPAWAGFEEGQQAFQSKRFDEARELWLQAAKRGEPESLYALGKMYGEGLGVLEDLVKARAYFALAAAKGHELALEARNIISQQMTNEERAASRTFASEFQANMQSSSATKTQAASKSKLLVAGYVKLLAYSDEDVRQLAEDWVDRNVQVFRSLSGIAAGYDVNAVTDDYNFYADNREARGRAQLLCQSHDADVFISSILHTDERWLNDGHAHVSESNWKRDLNLFYFDCAQNVSKRKSYQQTDDENWNLLPNIEKFVRHSKLAE